LDVWFLVIYFAPMSAYKILKNKHLLLDRQLMNEWERVVSISKSKHKVAATIATKFDLVSLTILNYCDGMGSDGFLKEAILEELKNI
jgi:hypothetical protein